MQIHILVVKIHDRLVVLAVEAALDGRPAPSCTPVPCTRHVNAVVV